MFSKEMPRLALAGMRSTFFPQSNHNGGILNVVSQHITAFYFSTNHNTIANSYLSNPIFPPLPINPVSRFHGGVVSLQFHSVRSISSKKPPRMGSFMEHSEYKEMYKRLSKETKSYLDIVCHHIFSKELIVNQDILELGALSQ